MKPVDHPPRHEIERLNREIEEEYNKDEMDPWDAVDSAIPIAEAEGPEPEDDPLTSTWQPKLAGAEMIERDPNLTGADVLEIKMDIRPYEEDDGDVPV